MQGSFDVLGKPVYFCLFVCFCWWWCFIFFSTERKRECVYLNEKKVLGRTERREKCETRSIDVLYERQKQIWWRLQAPAGQQSSSQELKRYSKTSRKMKRLKKRLCNA